MTTTPRILDRRQRDWDRCRSAGRRCRATGRASRPPTVIGGRPRSMAPRPMVAMMTAMIGRPSRGRSTTRSSAKPNATMTATAAATRGQHGHAVDRQRHRGDEARQHHELALREVDGLGRLVDQHEAERDQRIHQPDRQPAHRERQRELQLIPHHPLPHRRLGRAAARDPTRQRATQTVLGHALRSTQLTAHHAAIRLLSPAGTMSCTASVEVSGLLRPSSKVMSMVSRASLAPS